MQKSDQTEIEEFRRQIDTYMSIINRNKERLENDPWLEKQIRFWMESTRFLILELEIWDQGGNYDDYDATLIKAQKSLDRLHELFRQLN